MISQGLGSHPFHRTGVIIEETRCPDRSAAYLEFLTEAAFFCILSGVLPVLATRISR